jgi:hypothetical protein
MQFVGVVLVIVGLVLLIVFPVFGIVAGEELVLYSVTGGWAVSVLGIVLILFFAYS